MRERDDAEVIRASLDDPEAFEVVFERHYDAVRRYAQRRIGTSVGEELAARTFLVAFERRRSYRPDVGSARAWLFGIATNLIRHHLRDEQTHLRILGSTRAGPAEQAPDEDARLDALAAWPIVSDVLRSLPRRDRDAFLLVALADLSYADVAVALDVPIGTVRSRIHRVRRQLRERLTELAARGNDDGERDTDDG